MKRMKGKILAILMSLAMAFTMMPMMSKTVYADDTILSGGGTAADPYKISSYAELKDFADIVNGTNGKTKKSAACAILTTDIDASSSASGDWTPIGTYSQGYTGTFDGYGYKIIGVTATSGLFSTVAEEGNVKNLTVKIVSVGTDNQEYVGGIVNENLGTIENCTVECGNIKAKNAAGSVAGRSSGTIKNCTAKIDGKIEITGASDSHMSGGIAGNNRTGGIIKECRAYGKGSISNNNGNGFSGGIAGWNMAKIESCICEGSLKIHNNQKDYSGGIAGYNFNNIDNCLVYGDVVVGFSASGTYVGGLVGRMVSGKCSNSLYNSSQTPLNGKHPIVSMLNDGNIADCYYNTASGCSADGNGTAISDIYWLKCDSNITPTIKAEDKKTFAGRDFVYSGKDVTLSYDGLADNPSVTYRVNGEEMDGNAFKMPEQETSVEARVGIAISSLEDLKKSTFYNGSEQSPGTVQCSAGRIYEGTDYIVTKYQDSKGQETTEAPIDADTYTATIRGINNYAGNTTVEFLIAKAEPEITNLPTALEPVYNGEEQQFITAGTATGGTISYRLSTEDESSSNEKIPTAKDAGKYDIFYKVKGDKNYNDLSEQKLQAEIKKVKITITADDKSSKAGEALQDLTYKVNGDIVNGDDLGITVTTNADKDKAGTYDIKVDWNNNKNYDAVLTNGRYTVTAAPAPKPKTTVSGTPLVRLTTKGDNSLVVSWNKIQGADGYDIYFAYSGEISKYAATVKGNKTFSWADGYDIYFAYSGEISKYAATVKGNKTFSWTKSGLKKGRCYKAYVKAYVMRNGKKTFVKCSPLVLAYASGGSNEYTSAKAVTVEKASANLTVGKAFQIKPSIVKLNKNKYLMPKKFAPTFRYMSSNEKIATVSSGGKVTAKGKGSCYIYVYAHNGVSKQVKVTVQ